MAVWIPQWDLRCVKCSDGQKKFNGCEQDTDIPDRWKIREWTWLRCPITQITQTTISLMSAYNFLQKGILPYQVGYKRNSARYVEAMEIIGQEVRRLESENMRQMKK